MCYCYTAITACVIFMMFIMYLLVCNNILLERRNKRCFTTIILLVIVCTIAERCSVAFDGNTSVPLVVHKILKAIEFSLTPVIHVLMGVNLGHLDIGRRLAVLLGMNVLFEIVSAFQGQIFLFDDTNTYQHGAYFWFYLVVNMTTMWIEEGCHSFVS